MVIIWIINIKEIIIIIYVKFAFPSPHCSHTKKSEINYNKLELCFKTLTGILNDDTMKPPAPLKQYEFKNKSFRFNKWLTYRLVIVFLIFSIILRLKVTPTVQAKPSPSAKFWFWFHLKNLNTGLLFLFGCLALFYIQLYFKVKKESLLYIPSIGFQTTTTYANGRTVEKFHDINGVKDLIINEVVSMVGSVW